jgi:hypothetical protein
MLMKRIYHFNMKYKYMVCSKYFQHCIHFTNKIKAIKYSKKNEMELIKL